MLLATDWARRIGLNPSLMDDDPMKSQGIGTLVTWRFLSLAIRNAWCQHFMTAGRGYPFSAQTAFWQALETKRAGLFGSGNGAAVDPLAAFRHPWCLSSAEFATAKAMVDQGQAPTNLDDDRTRLSTIFTWIGPFLGTLTPIAGMTGILSAPAAILGGTIGALSSADAFGEKLADALEKESFKEQLPRLKGVYAREKKYRAVELEQPLAA